MSRRTGSPRSVVTLATARDICQFLMGDPNERPLRPSTLRTWASRGKLEIHGKRAGWNLYDVDAVMRLVQARDTFCEAHDRRITTV